MLFICFVLSYFILSSNCLRFIVLFFHLLILHGGMYLFRGNTTLIYLINLSNRKPRSSVQK